MMLLSDIPDKLAVTSFIYQMYNYFTKAERSAITRDESLAGQAQKESESLTCTSPFDLSQFEKFRLSPVSPDSTTTHQFAMEKYSRHSREETVPIKTGSEDTVPVPTPPILEPPAESESYQTVVETSENSSENLSVFSHHESLPAVTTVENGSLSVPSTDLPKHKTTSENDSHRSPVSEHRNVEVAEPPQHEGSKQHTAAPPQTYQYVPAASPRTNRGGKSSPNSTPAESEADKQVRDTSSYILCVI